LIAGEVAGLADIAPQSEQHIDLRALLAHESPAIDLRKRLREIDWMLPQPLGPLPKSDTSACHFKILEKPEQVVEIARYANILIETKRFLERGIAGIFMFAVRASTGNLADKMKVPIGDRLVAENSDHQP